MTEPASVRHVAVHLHIFKNAGTSLDRYLATCFANRMAKYDKKQPGAVLTIAETADFIEKRPELRCFSSHQVRLPLPVSDTTVMHPMFFLRDPVERVQSCFHFERDVQKIVPETVTMEDYVRRNLNNPKINAIINLQTSVICDNRLLSAARSKADITSDVFVTALVSLHAARAFGLVEYFDESLLVMKKALAQNFPELASQTDLGSIRENVSENGVEGTAEKLRYVKASLTASTYLRLVDQTAADRSLYEEAKKLFFARYGSHGLDGAH